jgi:hypothetical protein
MKEITIGKKKYKLAFGYAVVAKGGIVKKLIELQELFSQDEENPNIDMSDNIEKMMGCIDELLLASLQKYHADDFWYSVRTGNGHDEALEKVDALLDKYLDAEDADPIALIGILSDELENNGFLHHILRQAEIQPEQ